MIVHPELWGRWVEVMHAAPSGAFLLPDGLKHAANPRRSPSWVCQSLGPDFIVRQVDVRTRQWDGLTRACRYAVIQDHWLRPIRGEEPAADIPAERERELSDA